MLPRDFVASDLYGKPQVQCEYMQVLGISVNFCQYKQHLGQEDGSLQHVRTKGNISYLICIQFHVDEWHPLVHTAVMLQHAIHILRDVLHHQIQKKLIFTCCRKKAMLQRNNIWVIHQTHQLQLSIFIASILQDLLNGNRFSSFQAFCLIQVQYITNQLHILDKGRKLGIFKVVIQFTYLKYYSKRSTTYNSFCHITDCLQECICS